MSYALVENGNVTTVGLPQTGVLKNGCTVSGYNLLDEEVLADEGWLPFVDVLPEYDAETEVALYDGYLVEASLVSQKYKIEAKIAPTPNAEQRLHELESENASLKAETIRLSQRDAQMQDDQMLIMETLINAGILS